LTAPRSRAGRPVGRAGAGKRTGSKAGEEDKASTDEYDRTREEIVRAAAEIFSRDGFRAGTTKDIAAKVGLSQPSLYYYVGSKDALLSELALRLDHDMQETLVRARQVSSDPTEQFKAWVRELTRAVANDKDLFAVYWAESRWLPKKVATQVTADEQALIRDVERLVAKVQAQGALKLGPPAIVTQAIIGMVIWLYRWYRRSSQIEVDELADLFLRLIGLDDPVPARSPSRRR